MERGLLVSDLASFDSKTYIWETLQNIKVFLGQKNNADVLRKALVSTARNLGLLIDYMGYVEEESEEAEMAWGEGKRALKSFLKDEVDHANNMCHFINSLIKKRDVRVTNDALYKLRKFDEELGWIESIFNDAHFPNLDLRLGDEQNSALVIGLEEDVQVLLRHLIYDMPEVVMIVGVQGIGKTTLAMEVYKNVLRSHHFRLRFWVTISQVFETVDVLRNILKQIPPFFKTKKSQYTQESAEELAEELLHILRSVRCFIVLDNLLTPQAWTHFRKLVPLLTIGESRIIITTRTRRLAAANLITHEMRTLSDRQGWELFKMKVHVPLELEQLGREILRKCMGLPLAILSVVDILARRAAVREQWLEVLNQVNQNQKSVFHSLSACADSLPLHMKECLSCANVFHENYDIPKRRLIVLWVAEGLLNQEKGSNEPPEHLAERLLMEFIQQNMIQAVEWKLNGKVKTCRLNYFLRDNSLSKDKKETYLHANKRGVSSKSSSRSNIIRLADHLNIEDKCFLHIHGIDRVSKSTFRQNYRDLRSFVSFDSREGPLPGDDLGRFLHKGIAAGCFKMLRVLDLEGAFRPQLPESVGTLVQLRYLGLRRSYIEVLPLSIGNLMNLQTLDLKHTCIRSLPPSIWKNHQLRHLYLSESYRSRIVAPPSTSSLIDIQTLWGGFVDEETLVAAGLDRLINVRKLGLVCRLKFSQQMEMAAWVARLDHLESLRLKSVDERVQPSNLYLNSLSGLTKLSSVYLLGRLENPTIVHDFPQSLTEITLSLSGLKADPMRKLGQLPNLRILNLYSGSYVGKFLVCHAGSFPLLQVLNLWKLEELEVWILEKGAMKILRHVEIRSCNKLKRIPDGLEHLEHCRELKVTKMPCEFKARVAENRGKDWHKVAHIPSIVIKE